MMTRLLLALCAASLVCSAAVGAEVPRLAKIYAPDLVTAQRDVWPTAPQPWYLAGQVEQETCITLRSSRCWNPRTELRTSREHGVGLGQFTKAWRADGTLRFDKLTELATKYPSLHGWSWQNWADPHYQLTAIVLMNRSLYSREHDAATVIDRLSFTLSAYNGGQSGVLQDRRLCANTQGCDPSRWAGNVAEHSLKSRTPRAAYGNRSFYEINRSYVHNVLYVRRAKYRHFWESCGG